MSILFGERGGGEFHYFLVKGQPKSPIAPKLRIIKTFVFWDASELI
jgi:hypothetical protein